LDKIISVNLIWAKIHFSNICLSENCFNDYFYDKIQNSQYYLVLFVFITIFFEWIIAEMIFAIKCCWNEACWNKLL
jgi:hypothetical protein